MTATAMLMREIETLPEESVGKILDFTLFLKSRGDYYQEEPKVKSMFGAFPGISTDIYREEDRI